MHMSMCPEIHCSSTISHLIVRFSCCSNGDLGSESNINKFPIPILTSATNSHLDYADSIRYENGKSEPYKLDLNLGNPGNFEARELGNFPTVARPVQSHLDPIA